MRTLPLPVQCGDIDRPSPAERSRPFPTFIRIILLLIKYRRLATSRKPNPPVVCGRHPPLARGTELCLPCQREGNRRSGGGILRIDLCRCIMPIPVGNAFHAFRIAQPPEIGRRYGTHGTLPEIAVHTVRIQCVPTITAFATNKSPVTLARVTLLEKEGFAD